MKHRALLAAILCLLTSVLIAPACGQDLDAAKVRYAQDGTETGLRIVVDPRIELMNIALTFTDMPYYGKISDVKYLYHQDVLRHFGPFKDHPAIQSCRTFPYFKDMSFPETMMLYVSDPPNMKLKYVPRAEAGRKVVDEALKLIDLLNQYADESKFTEFWNSHRSFYDGLIAPLQAKLPYQEHVQRVNNFYGVKYSRFVCVVSPILFGASFGPTLETQDMRIPHFVTGPHRIENGQPVFTDRWMKALIFHEFSHSFVNPLCEKYRDLIARHESLLPHFLQSEMIRTTYGEWFILFHEHIVRAVECWLLDKAGWQEESEATRQNYLKFGFTLLPAFIKKVESYAAHRDQYPTFADFFPEVLKTLDEIDPAMLPNAEKPGLETRAGLMKLDEAGVKRVVEAFFMSFNKKDMASIKSSLHPDVSVSKNKGQTALAILAAAIDQLPAFDGYSIMKISPEDGMTRVTGKFEIKGQSSDFTFVLDGQGKFLVIDMFNVNAK